MYRIKNCSEMGKMLKNEKISKMKKHLEIRKILLTERICKNWWKNLNMKKNYNEEMLRNEENGRNVVILKMKKCSKNEEKSSKVEFFSDCFFKSKVMKRNKVQK